MLPKINPTTTKAWKALKKHYREMKSVQMKDLFAKDARRFKKMSFQFEDTLVDLSKNRITDKTLDLLLQLAKETNLKEAIQQQFSGAKINETEGRAVLHAALTNQSNRAIKVDGKVLQKRKSQILSILELEEVI